jgi:type II secretory pathway component PulM
MANATRAQAPAPSSGGLRAIVEAQFEAMSPRDRKLLMGLVGFITLVITAIVFLTIRGAIYDKQTKVKAAQDALDYIQVAAAQYTETASKIATAEDKLKEYKGQPASAYLEKVAGDTGLRDQFTVNQQGSEVVEGLRQTTLRVDLRKIQLASALQFIHTLETSGYPLSINMARFHTGTVSGTEGKVIDLTLEVVTYQLEGA